MEVEKLTVEAGKQILTEGWRFLSKKLRWQPPTTLGRFREIIAAHGLGPSRALECLGIDNASMGVDFDDAELAKVITPAFLNRLADYLNVRIEWLRCAGDHPYHMMDLERSFELLVAELLELKRRGTDHCVQVFKSRSHELEYSSSQFGAMVFSRAMSNDREPEARAYWPVFSLQSWGEPKQKWLALRAIWAARYLNFTIFGHDLLEDACKAVSEGRLLPGTLRGTMCAGSWHPEDYVVRPSAVAKGSDTLVCEFESDYGEILSTMAANAGCDVWQWGSMASKK